MAKVSEIDLAEFFKLSNHAHVFDVRESDELCDGMIPGAVHLALSEFPEKKEGLPTDKSIIFYCRSGKRSFKAAELVCSCLTKPVYSLVGGYLGYIDHIKNQKRVES